MPLASLSPFRRLWPASAVLRTRARSTLADLLERHARRHPQRPALRFEGHELSYRALDAAANRVAWWALGQQIGCGSTVGVLLENRPELVALLLGLAKTGARVALLPTWLSGPELEAASTRAQLPQLIAGSECLEQVASLPFERREQLGLWILDDPTGKPLPLPAGARALDAELSRHSERAPDPRVRARIGTRSSALKVWSSQERSALASTSISHAHFRAGARPYLENGFGRRDVLFCSLPLQHASTGLLALAAVLEVGATLALARRFDARRSLADAAAAGATAIAYDARSSRLLLREPKPQPALRPALWLAVGSGLRQGSGPDFREQLGLRRVCEVYAPGDLPLLLSSCGGKPGRVGQLGRRDRRRARLVRAEIGCEALPREAGCLVECRPGEIGELIVRADAAFELAAEGRSPGEAAPARWLHDVLESGDRWLRSGDLMRCDSDGFLHHVGRAADSFRWRGVAEANLEIADALAAFPDLALCSVYGVPLPESTARADLRGPQERAGVAALTLAEGAAFDGLAFYRFACAALPAHALPRIVRIQGPAALTGRSPVVAQLRAEGFDPRFVKQRLYFCDDAAGRYLPLTPERYLEIESGQRRL